MGYPVRILVEDRVVEILQLELIIGVDDGLHLIVLLDNVEPSQHRSLELGIGLVLGLMLDIKHWGQIAVLKLHLTEEMLRLTLGR